MSTISISPVTTSGDRSAFIQFQWTIYSDHPHWVPPLLMDRRKLMDKKKNPFYTHAEAEFFLARRDGKIVGRIGAIINHHHNKEHNDRVGFFGFFECVNDQVVADALFETAGSWLKARGMDIVRGPASPSVNDEYGLLVAGFDHDPVVLMPYNPQYYVDLIEKAGFTKAMDLYAYKVTKERAITERLARVSAIVKQREGLTFRSLNMKDFDNEVKIIRDVYNRAWQYNWGAVPMTDAEFETMAKDMKPIVVPELVIIAEFKGLPIGFALSIPDLNIALKHNRRGYLLPGLWCLWRYKKKMDFIRIIVLGVVPEYKNSGVGGVLFHETARRAVENGYPHGEASWVLEDNVMMNRGAELMNAERTKTYRIYERTLS